MIQKLTKSTTFEIYQSASREGDRGAVEQVVMTQGLCDSRSDDEVGRTLQAVSNLINRYEVLSGLLEGVFRGLIWGLTRLNGQASPEFLAQDSTLDDFLGQVRTRLEPAASQFRVCLESFERDSLANKRGSVDIDRMHKLLEDSAAAMRGNNDCVTAVMDRHLRVQKEKHKGVWIEVDKYWTLMPGFGDTSDEPQPFEGYLHPYRIMNLYGMLTDLKMVTSPGVNDGEEDE